MAHFFVNAGSSSQDAGGEDRKRSLRTRIDAALGLAKGIQDSADILAARLAARQSNDNPAANYPGDTDGLVNEMCDQINAFTHSIAWLPGVPGGPPAGDPEFAGGLLALRELAVAMRIRHDELLSIGKAGFEKYRQEN
ncbi:MAG: hypothetical protein FWB79_05610 [Treponema sp.]|nr:hypothetical protein [Treponema sp.]